MAEDDTLFEWRDGVAYFRGLRVERHPVNVAGHSFEIMKLRDAADLLDEPDFAKRFIEDDIAPYGLELWPAALMLAEHVLLDELGRGRRAVELGCGLGFVAIAAAARGWRVTATDNELTSLRFAVFNTAINGAEIETFEELDWRHPPRDYRFARVFGADVLYQLTDHEPILRCIDALLAADGLALVADPNRGVADRFEELGRAFGFKVETLATSTPGGEGKVIGGRIFRLRRARALYC